MTKALLALHVLAAIVAIGPIAVAASMFPAELRRAHRDPAALPVLRALHRICRVYAVAGLAVPILGLATGAALGVLSSPWVTASIALTGAAAVVLAGFLLPYQRTELDALQADTPGPVDAAARRLAMTTGIFNLMWAAVTVLMILRPGSTTAA